MVCVKKNNGNGIRGKRRGGRPTRRWMDNIREDMRDMRLEEEDTGDRGK